MKAVLFMSLWFRYGWRKCCHPTQPPLYFLSNYQRSRRLSTTRLKSKAQQHYFLIPDLLIPDT